MITITLDERGKRCPLPVIALGKAAKDHPGALIEVLTDDPAADHDIPAWCRMRNKEWLGAHDLIDGGRKHSVRA